MSNTGLPKVNVASGVSSDEQPEVDISDEEFLQFDTSKFPVIVTLTKVMNSNLLRKREHILKLKVLVSHSHSFFKLNVFAWVTSQVGSQYIVDATSKEESQMSSAISVSVNRQGHICGVTKRGGAGLDPIVMLDMLTFAKTVSEQLIEKLDSEIAAAEALEEDES